MKLENFDRVTELCHQIFKIDSIIITLQRNFMSVVIYANQDEILNIPLHGDPHICNKEASRLITSLMENYTKQRKELLVELASL